MGQAALPGTRIPARPFTIGKDDDAVFCRVVGDEQAGDGTAHPLWGFILSRRTFGIDLHELLALADFDVADGPLLGEFDMRNDGPLRIGETYEAEIVIDSYERKSGRRTGPFDLLGVTHSYTDAAGRPAGTYRQVYVLPRRSA